MLIHIAAFSVLLRASAAAPSPNARPTGSTTQSPTSAAVAVQVQPAAVTVRQLSYAQEDGSRNAATLVTPASAPAMPRPAILFLHWYEPPRPTSNRTEFLADAVEMAQSGAISLLVDTPWSRESWFARRDAAHDYEFTVAMTKNVRRAIDVLLAQPGVDRTRVALVGHDFGAMWGALAAAEDPRVTHLVYMAGTRSFSDWYLFTPKKEGADRDAFIARMAPLDPIAALAKVSPRPVLLQFGTGDKFVTNEAAQAMAAAVSGPNQFRTYDFEHELTYQARVDRLAWLREQLRLRS